MATHLQYNVYGVGNALVDIQARVGDATLEELRFAKGIMTLVDEDTQTRVLSSLKGVQITRCAGGSAANTIMGVADFGGTAAYAGKVADDDLGRFFLQDMRKVGVVIEVPPAQGGYSGTCVILITEDAERTMLTHLGVSATLGPSDVDESEIAKAEYLYVEGYLFAAENNKAAALKAIELAKANGVKVALTVSDPFLIHLFKDEFWKLIDGPVDLLFCNLEEARSLTDHEDPIECARVIHDHAANVALTLGPNGSLLMVDGDVIAIEGVPTKAIDTTGAGDMYAAGLLYGITNGLTWQQSGHLASHAAARIVSQLGARLAQPFTPAEIDALAR
ncbi:MAG: adenosine kinase [Planctomycetota bacterium]|nr:adenosine kinase [Planctomycetaceae bacterium]MDQ3331147.1 adenosine kinase [Planctomycetota bacterium]